MGGRSDPAFPFQNPRRAHPLPTPSMRPVLPGLRLTSGARRCAHCLPHGQQPARETDQRLSGPHLWSGSHIQNARPRLNALTGRAFWIRSSQPESGWGSRWALNREPSSLGGPFMGHPVVVVVQDHGRIGHPVLHFGDLALHIRLVRRGAVQDRNSSSTELYAPSSVRKL